MKPSLLTVLVLLSAALRAQSPVPAQSLGGAFLLQMPRVQQELKLTAAQKKLIQGQMSALTGVTTPSKPGEKPDPAKMRQRWEQAQKKRSAAEKEILASLSAAQKKRLREITLQAYGLNVVMHPDVEKELGITAAQRKKILQIQQAQGEAMRKLFQPSGRPPRSGASKAEYEKYSKEQTERMKNSQAKLQKLRKDTDAKIKAVLTAAQRAKWQAMTGKPFALAGAPG